MRRSEKRSIREIERERERERERIKSKLGGQEEGFCLVFGQREARQTLILGILTANRDKGDV